MLSPKLKSEISHRVQAILEGARIFDDELPEGEIHFILHIDGKESWSWANIRNTSDKDIPVPSVLVRNLTV